MEDRRVIEVKGGEIRIAVHRDKDSNENVGSVILLHAKTIARTRTTLIKTVVIVITRGRLKLLMRTEHRLHLKVTPITLALVKIVVAITTAIGTKIVIVTRIETRALKRTGKIPAAMCE